MSAREGLEFQTTIVSDSAPLNGLVALMLESDGAIRCMRDPTRGGVATVINEFAKSSGVEIVIEETAVPVRNGVRAACEILGLDPLISRMRGQTRRDRRQRRCGQSACGDAPSFAGSDACRIGTVTRSGAPRVLLRTAFGTTRLLDVLAARRFHESAENSLFSPRRSRRILARDPQPFQAAPTTAAFDRFASARDMHYVFSR